MRGSFFLRSVPFFILPSSFFLLLYHSTLLPGLELGDSPSFQTMVGSAAITPRDGYPLYYAIGGVALWLTGAERAYVLNLLSAILGAIACGLVAIVAGELARSRVAGLVAAALFGGSYTFWSQAVIAEVYTLHIALIALTLLLLLRWDREPSTTRLALFFAVYALSFGNHLAMLLLLPAYAGFLVLRAPGGWRSMLRPEVLALAALSAAAGAAQYLWNFQGVWLWPSNPSGPSEALAIFWFDVSKSDWRDTMVLRVPAVMAGERLRMYAFDVHQQFGIAGVAIAVAGAWRLAQTAVDRFLLLFAVLLINVLFALTYNVGDSHVFLLPAHLMLALCAAVGAAWVAGAVTWRGAVSWRGVAFGALLLFAGARIYQNYPALDRSGDHRPRELLDAVTAGVDDRTAILLTDINWQVQNGLTYYGNALRPEVAYVRLPEVALYAPALVRDNAAIGRQVLVTDRAKRALEAAYGPILHFEPDGRSARPPLASIVRALPSGTRYALTLLRPSREFTLDMEDLSAAVHLLTGGGVGALGNDEYVVLAGQVGAAPRIVHGGARPFRVAASVQDVAVEVRMDSWLAFDTIRRMGFGHVIANRRHTLIVERGMSFVAFDAEGIAIETIYRAGIFEPPEHYFVSLRRVR